MSEKYSHCLTPGPSQKEIDAAQKKAAELLQQQQQQQAGPPQTPEASPDPSH
jgi:hypothetical protein